MRRQILRGVSSCDYEFLERLSSETGSFRYSFAESGGGGTGAGLARLFRRLEAGGQPVTRVLFQLLHAPHRAITDGGRTIYVWPSASMVDASEQDWLEVERIYGRGRVENWRQSRRYGGHRVGIDAEGRWLFFIRVR